MCTIGAIILGPDEYLLYKNKDFGQIGLEEKITSTPELFGVAGVETFDRLDTNEITYSGLSVGANVHGLICCDAHVSFSPKNGVNYDRLVEVALTEGKDVPSAIQSLEAFVKKNPVWAGNLVLTDGRLVASVEAKGSEIVAQLSASSAAKTNHHDAFLMDVEPASESSKGRLKSATSRLSEARKIDDIFSLLSSHDAGETGVCNHLAGRKTIYSYILHVSKGQTRMYVAEKLPCQTSGYVSFDIPLGDQWSSKAMTKVLDQYPQANALQAANA